MQISSNNTLRYSNPANKMSFAARIPKYKVFGEVSDGFVKEIETGLQKFPDKLFQQIQKNEIIEIRLAPKGSEAYADDLTRKLQFERELIPGSDSTYDALSASLIERSNSLNQSISSFGFYEKPVNDKKNANRGSVAHELFHKVDELLKKVVSVKFSQTKGFKDVVRKDLAEFAEKKKLYPKLVKKYKQKNIDYMTQKSTPENLDPYGLGEIFANCGASLTTGTNKEVRENIKFMEKFFPETREYVQKFLNLLGMK